MESESEKKSPFEVRVKVQIHKETSFFGPGIVELLGYIRECGSVKDACRRMELSYSKGWFILNRAEEELGYPLIQRNHGGKKGGGAALTESCEKLLARYEELEKNIQAYAEEEFKKILSDM